MIATGPRRPQPRPPGRSLPDGGFSLIELLVSLGVFSILMIIVGAATAAGFNAIRAATARSTIQQQSQNAMEWATRLVRYADKPEGQTTAIPEAGSAAVTVYTYSGTGTKADVPYKARLSVVTAADGKKSVVSDVWTPDKSTGLWTWPTTSTSPVRRTLMTVPAGTGSPLTLTYYACTPSIGCLASRRAVPTPTSAALSIQPLEVPESIVIGIGDPSLPDSRVIQAVKLVNLS